MPQSISYVTIKPVAHRAGSNYNVCFRVGDDIVKVSDIPKDRMYGENMENLSNLLRLLKQCTVSVVDKEGGYDVEDWILEASSETSAKPVQFHTTDLKSSVMSEIFENIETLINPNTDSISIK